MVSIDTIKLTCPACWLRSTNQWTKCHLAKDNLPLFFQAAHVISEDFSDSIMPVSFTKTHDFRKEVEDEVIPSYIVQFEKDVQDDIIMLGSFSLEQVRVRNYKTISSFGAYHVVDLSALYTSDSQW